MILDEKYIIVKQDKIKETLSFLYSIGYDWAAKNGQYVVRNFLDKDKIIIISGRGEFQMVIYWDIDIDRIENKKLLNINYFLRESKLKRILK